MAEDSCQLVNYQVNYKGVPILSAFPRGYFISEWSRVVKGGTKWRAKRPLTTLRSELHFGAEGI
jgi:hypothetical protein